MADRRAGDPARLVASSDKIHAELGWKAQISLEKSSHLLGNGIKTAQK